MNECCLRVIKTSICSVKNSLFARYHVALKISVTQMNLALIFNSIVTNYIFKIFIPGRLRLMFDFERAWLLTRQLQLGGFFTTGSSYGFPSDACWTRPIHNDICWTTTAKHNELDDTNIKNISTITIISHVKDSKNRSNEIYKLTITQIRT